MRRWKPSISRPEANSPSEQQRAQQREQRRVRRVRAVREQQRPETRADQGPGREADEREGARDQPLLVAPDGHQEGERDDDPVEGRQGGLRLLAAGTIELRSPPRVPLEDDSPPSADGASPTVPCPHLAGSPPCRWWPAPWSGSSTESTSERVAGDFATAWERGDMRAMHELLSEPSSAALPDRALPPRLQPGGGHGHHDRDRGRRYRGRARRRGERAGGGRHAGIRSLRGELRACRSRASGWTGSRGSCSPSCAPASGSPATARRRCARRSLARRQGPGRGPRRRALLTAGGHRRLDRRPHGAGGDPEERRALYARGFPPDWPVGQSGLEEAFEERLRGRPGGELAGRQPRAGTRAAARSQAIQTTIHTGLQEAAVVALAGRLGGVAALDPRNGEIRALAGIAFSAPQPPGSTFKLVTTAAALEHGLVKPSTEFPVETHATIDGVELENANGESCGGSFRNSFAHSCNSVFARSGSRSARPRWSRWPSASAGTRPPPSRARCRARSRRPRRSRRRSSSPPRPSGSSRRSPRRSRWRRSRRPSPAGGVRHPPTLRPAPAGRDAGGLAPHRAHDRVPDDRRRGVRHRHRGGHPRRAVAGKTGTAELEDTRDPETGETPAARPDQHRRLVHRLRPARRRGSRWR